jgi:hypothetical protein
MSALSLPNGRNNDILASIVILRLFEEMDGLSRSIMFEYDYLLTNNLYRSGLSVLSLRNN